MTTTAYKVFTHDWCSPFQGGEPVFDGKFPFTLPVVSVDKGQSECAAGWNATERPEQALLIVGLWSTGRPSRLTRVETDYPVVHRGRKMRAASWTVVEEITDLAEAIRAMSAPFGQHAEAMAQEQLAWRRALGRPYRDKTVVIAGLKQALATRGLSNWTVQELPSAPMLWDSQATWDAWAAWNTGATWNVEVAWAAGDAEATRAAWNAEIAWTAWNVGIAGTAWDAWGAWDASNALRLSFAALSRWVVEPANLLTIGLRTAYEYGLATTAPGAPNILRFVMEEA